MLEFVPFMAIVVVVVLGWAAWNARRGVPNPDLDDLEPLPDADAAYRGCLEDKGVTPPRGLAVFRQPSGGLVIVGPDRLDAATQAALAECDRELAPRFTRDEGSPPSEPGW